MAWFSLTGCCVWQVQKTRQVAGFCVLRLSLVAVSRERGAERFDLLADARCNGFVAQVGEDFANPASQCAALVLLETAGGHGWGVEGDTPKASALAVRVAHADKFLRALTTYIRRIARACFTGS
jgi:hypothetical protein